MSTLVLGVQTPGAYNSHLDFEFDSTPKNSPMFNAGDRWPSSQRDSAAYKGFSVPNARPSGRTYSFQPVFQQKATNDNAFYNKSSLEPFNDFDPQSSIHGTLAVSTAGLQSSPAMFTASNQYDPATVSPMNTHFDVDSASHGSDIKMSFDGQMHHTAPSNFASFGNETDPLSSKGRCDSLPSNFGSQSPTMPQTQTGRRRGSEYAAPGSARAIYLEKNRKAASKCRSKQKRQQEELVETARHVERQNKILKAEVEMLKNDMRSLMELVGQHSGCPDTRLKLYVQREADRLATGGARTAMPSPFSSSSYSEPRSTGKVSSSEDE
ncbi:hypothetical protein E8E12_006334 [Didymella heteroderae]|uniref:BZIP domain-containing protein n=1 Tax=Didymella heteroderae TaxID=1769908 RepID=A0A9P4WU14_9PLEO|nr:hypothetical protein E8E12_006334 [Didymella heteroderae]